jgi:hypothetical protein
MESKLHTDGDLRPVPDPTSLTSALVTREVALLKELFNQRFETVDAETKATNELREADSRGIKTQIAERDLRVTQAYSENKTAIDAALAAQEKAVNKQNDAFSLSIAKSEAATTKQIDQHGVLLSTTAAGLMGKIDDIKERVIRWEGTEKGVADNRTSVQLQTMNTVSLLALILGTIVGVAGIVIALLSRHVV